MTSKKLKWGGGSALKSVVAFITMAAVLVLTLPAYKMESVAANNQYDWISDELQDQSFNYTISTDEGGGFGLVKKDGTNGIPQSDSGAVSQGSVFLIPDQWQFLFPGANVTGFFENATPGTSVDLRLNATGLAMMQALGLNEITSLSFTAYTLNSNGNYSINNTNFSFAPEESQENSTNTGNTSSNQNTTAPAPAVSAGQPMDSATIARLWSEFNAWLAARDQEIRAGQEAAKIRKEQQAQLDRDNLYFRNMNEAIRNGKSMVVFSDHSALRSQINGTYLANSVPGFAALFMGLPNPNLHIETWNITSRNAPDAVNAINGVAEQNGYTVGAMLQVNIGEKGSDGKPVYESTNKEPVANIVMGVPNSIRGDGAEYGAVQVLPGGEIHMYKDLPFNDNAVYLPLGIGRSAIGLVQTN